MGTEEIEKVWAWYAEGYEDDRIEMMLYKEPQCIFLGTLKEFLEFKKDGEMLWGSWYFQVTKREMTKEQKREYELNQIQ